MLELIIKTKEQIEKDIAEKLKQEWLEGSKYVVQFLIELCVLIGESLCLSIVPMASR